MIRKRSRDPSAPPAAPRALVTGGSSPIGAAVAEALAAEGCRVVIHARSNLAAAEASVRRIEEAGGAAEILALDLMADDAAERIARLAEPEPVHIVVHCAGGPSDMPFASMRPEDWRRAIDLNLGTLFTTVQPLLMPMIRARWGRIIAISSLAAVTGNRGQSAYAAAKGAMLPLMKSLSREYGSRGITANVVAPGLIDTPETRRLDNFDALAELSSLGRAGTAQEVAGLVAFLASPRSSYITGQLICVDGGSA